MQTKQIKIGKSTISNKNPFVLIAGPCVLTNIKESLYIAGYCKSVCEKYNVPYIFKGSYDKANRTNIKSLRGPGIHKGLDILSIIKEKLNIPVLTDIHNAYDADLVGSVVDIIQIPAFLSRQTDLIVESAKTNKVVNIKKGQFLAPNDMKSILGKSVSTGNKKIMLTERGTSFGYNNLIVDYRGIEKMKSFGYPVIFDATHSVQLPGSAGTQSGGEREYILPLSKAAAALGVAGLFMEVFPDPAKSPSDSATVLPLKSLSKVLGELKKIDKIIKETRI
ncbi:3-deoxy-8-phosphooctulonate synthase [bacterium]